MIFKNINAVSPSGFFLGGDLFHSSFCRIQNALLNVLFQFLIVLNVFKYSKLMWQKWEFLSE